MATRETKLPSIGDMPDNLDESLTSFLSSIKESIEIREGRRADSLDRTLIRRDLQKIGIDVRALDKDPPSYPFRDLITGEWRVGTKLLDVTDPTAAQDAATKNYVDSGNFDARIKGWVQFDGTGTAAKQDSFNASTLSDHGTGDYELAWDTDFANDDYAVIVGSNHLHSQIHTMAAGWTRVNILDGNHALVDTGIVCIIAIGDQ